jgi:hypothetical protein
VRIRGNPRKEAKMGFGRIKKNKRRRVVCRQRNKGKRKEERGKVDHGQEEERERERGGERCE